MSDNMYPIDLVVLWVDGSDPAWLAEKARYSVGSGDAQINRYREWGTLKYLFRGVEKFLPWVNKVHFVTWGHLPAWLDINCPKLNVVNHRDYIPKKYLPTFNSNPIELNLHRIDSLAEHFICTNDDMFFLRPMSREDFFVDGLPVDSAVQTALQIWDINAQSFKHIGLNNLAVLNKHFPKRPTMIKNLNKWFSLKYGKDILKNLYLLPLSHFTGMEDYHIPYPYHKSTFAELWQAEPEVMDAACCNRFRSHYDVSHWLMRYWRLAKGEFVPGKPHRGMNFIIDSRDPAIKAVFSDRKRPMLCLNDCDPNLDFEQEKAFIIDLFEQILPEKSAFEL